MLVVVFSKGTLLFLMLALYILFGLIRFAVQSLTKLFKKTENEPKGAEKFSRIDI